MKPIFILGAHKSGTSLLRSLLDGHPNLAVIPFETHIAKRLDGWINYPYQRNFPKKFDQENFKTSAINWIRKVNRNDDPYSDSDLSLELNESLFISRINGIAAANKTDSVEEYLRAAYLATNNPLEDKDIVEKSVENHEYAIDLHHMFPSARFVHIVRNPYANVLSLRNYKSKGTYPDLEPIVNAIASSFYYLYRNRALLDEYYVIRYEDLVSNPLEVIRDLCDRLRIEFDEKLLTPTSLGKLWAGNSVTDLPFDSISPRRAHFDKSHLSVIEIMLINKHIGPILNEFNYQRLSPNGSRYSINKKESLRTYLKNRCLLARDHVN